jgi:hypothetical protein
MIDWTSPRKYKDSYNFDFRLKNKIKNKPLKAAIKTVKHITKNYPAPYTLCLSGGVDSQAMLYAWKESGVKFETCCAIYNTWLNDYDIAQLKEFAKRENIKIKYIDIDVIKFLEEEHDTYANKYECGSPQITTFMKIADTIAGGTVIMSGNFKSDMSGVPDYNNFAMFKYGLYSKRSIVPWFFAETEELFHSFEYYYKQGDIQSSEGFDSEGFDVEPKTAAKIQYETKIYKYQNFGFPVIPQESKQNGFERIKEIYDMRQEGISKKDKLIRTPRQHSIRNFDILFRNKYELKFAKYSYNVKI